MSALQIEDLEDRFSLKLPDFYKNFLQEHEEAIETLDVGSGPLGENELMTSTDALVEANQAVRSPGLWYFGEHPWPAKYFVVGSDVYGCTYFIDTTERHKGILFSDIYDWDIVPVADDCLGLIEYLKRKREE
jgi:hypothetical protein